MTRTIEGEPMIRSCVKRQVVYVVLLILAASGSLRAQQQGTLAGTVSDPLGGRIASASVTLLLDGQSAGQATTSEAGAFAITGVADGRYQVRVEAGGFAIRTTDPMFVAGSGRPAGGGVLLVGAPPQGGRVGCPPAPPP